MINKKYLINIEGENSCNAHEHCNEVKIRPTSSRKNGNIIDMFHTFVTLYGFQTFVQLS